MKNLPPPEEQRIRRTMEHLRHGTTDEYNTTAVVNAAEFIDADLASVERIKVFGRVPSIVCHASEICSPGDTLSVPMPRNNIIVVRAPDQQARAFVNSCTRCGGALEGNSDSLTCPQDGFTWTLDGTGSAEPSSAESGSHADLVRLPAQERHGFVWMVDGSDASIDVADWLGPEVDAILHSYQLESLITYRSQRFDEQVNWKIMQDAFIDNYHVQYAHPNTAGKHVHTNVQTVEDFGRHARMLTPRKTIDRWLEEDQGDRSLDECVIDGHFLLPNSTLLRQPDHFELLTFRPHPTDAGRSWMEMRLLVPTIEASGLEPDRWNTRWNKNWNILEEVLQDEDVPLLRGSQQAMESCDAGPMVIGRNEVVNHIFHREIKKLVTSDH